MKKQEWNEGLNHLDPALVEEYILQKESLKKSKAKRKNSLRITSLAACFALIVSTVIAIPMLTENAPSGQHSSDDPSQEQSDDPSQEQSEISLPEVPVWEDAQYTAEEIAAVISSLQTEDGVATNAYTKVYVPHERFLNISPPPSAEHLGIYQYNLQGLPLDRGAFTSFVDAITPRLAEAMGRPCPEYELHESELVKSLDADFSLEDHYWFAWQTETTQQFTVFRSYYDRLKITLDGEAVCIDGNLSDEEIIASLEEVKIALFDIYGVTFTDVEIRRNFSEFSGDGADWIVVYFYNGEDPANTVDGINTVATEYISVEFDEFERFPSENKGGKLSASTIRFVQKRLPSETLFSLIGNAKRISLEEAEALLYNGYVFGGHSCPLCMAEQEKVNFEGYDYVTLEYVNDYDYEKNGPTVAIPFYAFYKKIGTAPNGNLIYAKTYVSAIPVSGYTEYFEKQKENHGKYTFPETEYEPYPG